MRRLLVLGVCALGVGALYLVPSLARSPQQVGSRDPSSDLPTTRAPWGYRSGPAARPGPTATVTATATVAGPVARRSPAEPARQTDEPRDAAAAARRTGATAGRPGRAADETAPAPVRRVRVGSATPDELRLTWPASTDDTGVVAYRIWLNGFLVAVTPNTRATLSWFNDDAGQHIVQIRAVDAAGNQSTPAASVLVQRPEPPVSASPTPTTEPPAGSLEPTATGRAGVSPSVSDDPTPGETEQP